MAHHKRGRRKNLRAGCLFCKPHKGNGTKGTKDARTQQQKRADLDAADKPDLYEYDPLDARNFRR